MKLIGTGYYYRVYDLGNGRVRKILKGKLEMALHIICVERFRPRSSLRAIRKAYASIVRLPNEYKRLISTVDLALFGNPTFITELEYEQDTARPFEKFIAGIPIDQAKRHLDAYIEHIQRCWEYGFCEKVFNFTLNNGIDGTGNLILLDFNEITFEKEEALRRIENRRWERSWSCKTLPENLRTYYCEKMQEAMTVANVHARWGRLL